jgi:multiphosphoryl transfer protein
MVSIVIVSHSAALASGVLELAQQMTQGQVKLAAAGGIDDPDNPIGTDALKVQEAIESVYSHDGVLVLMDLGSALLSAEMALEFLPPDQQANVYLSEAPLVEGAMAAAVQAAAGGDIHQVMAEARTALAAKASQLGITAPEDAAVATAPSSEAAPAGQETIQLQLVVHNRLGLHARPAARFVTTANRFTADIAVLKNGRSANAKSINQVATLGVRQGDAIVVTAAGGDAVQALAALQQLADDNFGDPPETEEPAAGLAPAPAAVVQSAPGALSGIPASPGIAIGPAAQYRPRLPAIPRYPAEDPQAEWLRLQVALNQARDEIQAVYRSAVSQVGPDEAAIFEAHALFLQDPSLLEKAEQTIFGRQINAEAAWEQSINQQADEYHALLDPYMQARAADVLDAGQRVLQHLLGLERPALDFDRPSILIAADLTPSDTARLDPKQVLGICTERGGSTSHSAILARALGIPAVVGLGTGPVEEGLALADIPDGQVVAIDGDSGRLWPRPEPDLLAELRDRQRQWQARQQQAKAASQRLAFTRDRQRIEVAANIGGPNDVPVALEYGAEGVGLFRTEFLFLDRETAPTEDEQLAAYRQVIEAMGDRPVIIRTLDIGGDKPVPYLELEHEENPFLGWRGIRLCLSRPDLFKPQLRAILRASAQGNVKLMFPMVGAVEEIRQAKALLNEVRQELAEQGQPFNEQMDVGVMIEVPSAVAVADHLAREVDFFSIGTNDLTQYVMAADRGNARVAHLANALQPAVLRLIRQTADAARQAGIWVGMCGELAGKALATPLLVGLGLTELSMSAPSIPAVKEAIGSLTLDRTQALSAELLRLDSAAAVEAYLARLS